MQPVPVYLTTLRLENCPDADYNGDYRSFRYARANVWLKSLPSGAVCFRRNAPGEWLLGASGRTQYLINSADSLMARHVPPRGHNRGWQRINVGENLFLPAMNLQTTASEDEMPACTICMERQREGHHVAHTHHPTTFHVSQIFGCECRGDDMMICADDVQTLLGRAQPKCPFCRTQLSAPAAGAMGLKVTGCPDEGLNGVYYHSGDDRKPWVPATGRDGPSNKASRVWQSMASPTDGAWFVGVGTSPMYRRRVSRIFEGGRFPESASWKPIGGSRYELPHMKLERVGGGYVHQHGGYYGWDGGRHHGHIVHDNGYGGVLYADGYYAAGWGEGG